MRWLPYLIAGQGRGRPPRVQNEAYSSLTYSVPRLYLAPTKPDHFDEVISLILASGAFPGALPAKQVRVCITNATSCEASEARDIYFVDGGIYENQPIRLAFEIAGDGAPRDQRSDHADQFPLSQGQRAVGGLFRFL